MSSSNYCFLTCIQISQEAGQVVWYSHLFKYFPQFAVIHTVKGFTIVNEAEIDVFWNSLAFSIERVTERPKVPKLQEEINCKWQTFPSLHKIKRLLLSLCWGHLVPTWANQCVFLKEMFFLSYVNETMYLLWNLPFFKMVPPKTNYSFLKPWVDNGSTK